MSQALAPSHVVTDRDPQGLKFVSIVAGAYNKARLSKEEAQLVGEAPGLAYLVDNFIAENRRPKQYAGEERQSSYGYLSGYRKPIAVPDQIDIMRSHWPQLKAKFSSVVILLE